LFLQDEYSLYLEGELALRRCRFATDDKTPPTAVILSAGAGGAKRCDYALCLTNLQAPCDKSKKIKKKKHYVFMDVWKTQRTFVSQYFKNSGDLAKRKIVCKKFMEKLSKLSREHKFDPWSRTNKTMVNKGYEVCLHDHDISVILIYALARQNDLVVLRIFG